MNISTSSTLLLAYSDTHSLSNITIQFYVELKATAASHSKCELFCLQ